VGQEQVGQEQDGGVMAAVGVMGRTRQADRTTKCPSGRGTSPRFLCPRPCPKSAPAAFCASLLSVPVHFQVVWMTSLEVGWVMVTFSAALLQVICMISLKWAATGSDLAEPTNIRLFQRDQCQ
jgi:hypothetical protein